MKKQITLSQGINILFKVEPDSILRLPGKEWVLVLVRALTPILRLQVDRAKNSLVGSLRTLRSIYSVLDHNKLQVGGNENKGEEEIIKETGEKENGLRSWRKEKIPFFMVIFEQLMIDLENLRTCLLFQILFSYN